MSEPSVSVVIPIYNEDENIIPTIHSLHKYLPDDYEIICVYDIDEDTTIPVLNKLIEEYPNLRLKKNTIARGPSGALRAGFQDASADRILVVMADQCDDFSQIPELIRLVPEEAAVACPSRYCKGGRQELDRTLKVWFPRSAGILLKLITGLPTYDPTNSYKMYSGELIKSISLESTVSFSVTLEAVVKAHCLGKKIVEIPTVWKDRTAGQSNFKIGPSIPAYSKWFIYCIFRNPLIRRLFFRS